jgi:hypothetical protein
VLDALAADDIDTDCNGVITMADLTVTMTTTRRRPLSQEEIEALIDLRIAQLRVLAAQTAVDWWRARERDRVLLLPPPSRRGDHGRAWSTGGMGRVVLFKSVGADQKAPAARAPAVQILRRERIGRSGDDLRPRLAAPR